MSVEATGPDFARRKRAPGLTPEQHAAREMAIGGSDAAAAVGLSRYKTPVRLWQEKLGLVVQEPYREDEFKHFGRILEQVVADEFVRRKGLQVRRVNQTARNKEHPFMVGHVDRRVVKARAGLECKTANWRMVKEWGEEGSDEIPIEYYIQCLHYLAIFGFDIWYCAVLLAGSDYRIYEVQRDSSVIKDLIEREAYFKNCLDTHRAPELQNLTDAFALYPQDNGASVTATVEISETLASFVNHKTEADALKKRIADEQLAVVGFMGEATTLIDTQGRPLASWKTQHRKSYTVEATDMRVMRTTKVAGELAARAAVEHTELQPEK